MPQDFQRILPGVPLVDDHVEAELRRHLELLAEEPRLAPPCMSVASEMRRRLGAEALGRRW